MNVALLLSKTFYSSGKTINLLESQMTSGDFVGWFVSRQNVFDLVWLFEPATQWPKNNITSKSYDCFVRDKVGLSSGVHESSFFSTRHVTKTPYNVLWKTQSTEKL